MPDGSARGINGPADWLAYGFPAGALDIWSPWLVGVAKWNAVVHEGFGTLASEWQNFVSRRVMEDFAFMQRVAQCRTPDQVWGVHADFWQKAVEDYSKEYLLTSRLAVGLTTKAAAAARCATQEASAEVLVLLKAA